MDDPVSTKGPTGAEIAATDPSALPADSRSLQPHRRRAKRKLTPAELRAADREKQALALRIRGSNFGDIAEQLGYATSSGAYRAVERALKRWGAEDADHLRSIEFARLDVITERLWKLIEAGDLEAVTLYLRISERRARMAGLDAPRRHEHTGPGGAPVQVQKVERAMELQALAVQVMKDHGGMIPGFGVVTDAEVIEDPDPASDPISIPGELP